MVTPRRTRLIGKSAVLKTAAARLGGSSPSSSVVDAIQAKPVKLFKIRQYFGLNQKFGKVVGSTPIKGAYLNINNK